MKLRTSKLHRYNMEVQASNDVVLKFNNEGIADLPEGADAEELILRDPSLSIVGEKEDEEILITKEGINSNPEKPLVITKGGDLTKVGELVPEAGEPISKGINTMPDRKASDDPDMTPKVGEPIKEKLVEIPAKEGEVTELLSTEAGKDLVEGESGTDVEDSKKISADAVDKFLGIEDLKVPELQSLCKDAKLPKKDWENLNKEPLIEYIKANIEG